MLSFYTSPVSRADFGFPARETRQARAKRFRFVDQNLIFALNRIVRASVRRSAVFAPNDVPFEIEC
jgi:hypothetical protein